MLLRHAGYLYPKMLQNPLRKTLNHIGVPRLFKSRPSAPANRVAGQPPLRFALVDWFDELRIPRLVSANDLRIPIGGCIILNQYLNRTGRLLDEKTLLALADEPFVVVSDGEKVDGWNGSIRAGLLNDTRRLRKAGALAVQVAASRVLGGVKHIVSRFF